MGATASLASPSSLNITSIHFKHSGEEKSVKDTFDEFSLVFDELKPLLESLLKK